MYYDDGDVSELIGKTLTKVVNNDYEIIFYTAGMVQLQITITEDGGEIEVIVDLLSTDDATDRERRNAECLRRAVLEKMEDKPQGRRIG